MLCGICSIVRYTVNVNLIEKSDPEYKEKQKIWEEALTRTEMRIHPHNSLLSTHLKLVPDNIEGPEKCMNELTLDTMRNGNRYVGVYIYYDVLYKFVFG